MLPTIFPGLMVHWPAGKFDSWTEPVDTTQVGWMIESIVGIVGVIGCAFTVKLVIVELQLLAFLATIECDPEPNW